MNLTFGRIVTFSFAFTVLLLLVRLNLHYFSIECIGSNVKYHLQSVDGMAFNIVAANDFNKQRTSVQSKLTYKVPGVDCAKLFKGDEQEKGRNWTEPAEISLRLKSFIDVSRSVWDYCDTYKLERRFITKPLTQEEADFPLAYSILVFKDVELFERLLRAVYRPQHYYCVHIDLSSEKVVHDAVRAIVNCFPNIFFPLNLIDVEYRKSSTLAADLLCMRELLGYSRWKYFINLTGQEFPLQTSIALVRILKAFNGANSIEGTVKRRNNERYVNTDPLPVNFTLTKGAVHIVASRAYVDYAINNESAVQFLAWVNKTLDPDETFFSTLNHSPHMGVPGAYTGEPESFTEEYPFIARFKNWIDQGPFSFPCAGKTVHSICIFGVGDLPLLVNRMELFVNKFHVDFQPAAYACMEELLANRTLDELNGINIFSAAAYEQLSFVTHHV